MLFLRIAGLWRLCGFGLGKAGLWLLLGAAESDGRKSGGAARQTCRQGFVCADSGIGVMELQVAADATMESLVLAILRLFSPCRDDME